MKQASIEITVEVLKEAEKWVNKPNTLRLFNTSRYLAKMAVAEYLANEKGFTLIPEDS